jgi:hypothetical protein
MDNSDETMLPEKFTKGFADIPDVPGHLYAGIRRRIDRKRTVRRAIWAIAASLILVVTAFQATHYLHSSGAVVAEAGEELSSVDSYINSTVYEENDNSYVCYEETLYQE